MAQHAVDNDDKAFPNRGQVAHSNADLRQPAAIRHGSMHNDVYEGAGTGTTQAVFTSHAPINPKSAADLQSGCDCREMMGEMHEQLSGVDILVNNAGIQYVSPVHEFPEDKWCRVFDSTHHSLQSARIKTACVIGASREKQAAETCCDRTSTSAAQG